jgi:hypothetical protein
VEALSVSEGAYLTDGQRLFQVIREWLPNGQVLLEDAGDPSLPSEVKTVQQLVADHWRVVRPVA